MGNFIDKTFTVIADILLKILPASIKEKKSFFILPSRYGRSNKR
jgi:hypothetical protein